MYRSEALPRRYARISVELIQETGVEEVDDFLYTLVNVLRLSLGEYLRAVFVIGSYAHGGYTPDSDLDLCFIWQAASKGRHDPREGALITHLARLARRHVDPMYRGRETPFYDPSDFGDPDGYPCGPILRLAVKEHSLLLYGEDIRPRIALSRREDLLQDVLVAPFNWIKQAHYPQPFGLSALDEKIRYPLMVPHLEREDLGFGNLHRVATAILGLARALVFLETGEFLFRKQEVAAAYERHVGGPWVKLVRDIHYASYGESSEPERQKAHVNACRQMTDLENYFLETLMVKGIDISSEVLVGGAP